MSDLIVELSDVTKRYRGKGIIKRSADVIAVDNVSLQIRRGESLGLVGESGSGKSTIARMVNGLIAPTSGTILTAGQDVTKLKGRELRTLRRGVAMVFQDPLSSLNPRQTVRQTLENVYRAHGETTTTDDLVQLLESVGLNAGYLGRYPHEASGGQLQRVAIARALALKPDLIIADEPTSALDVSVRAQILNLLADLQRDHGISFLHVSHDLAVIRLYSDRVAVMKRGKIVETGPSAEIFRSPTNDYTRSLVAATPEPELEHRQQASASHTDAQQTLQNPTRQQRA